MANPFVPPLSIKEVDAIFQGSIQISGILPAGGQGALFLIDWPPNNGVLKIYQNAHTLRAEQEAEALEILECEYIVSLFKWGRISCRKENCIFTITEHIDGDTLYQVLATRILSEKEGRRIGYCLLEAINSLWSKERIIHRDINPKNIIVRPNGDAVLIDLGIARNRNRTRLTTWGVVWGTESYMSPEQAAGRRGLTFKSDLFSLGIVLYQSVSGIHPFLFRQDLIGHHQPQPLYQFANISQEFSNIVSSFLEKDPIDRPTDLSNILSILQKG